MKKSSYRIKEVDVVCDIYLLQKHIFMFIWKTVGVGSKSKCLDAMNNIHYELKKQK